MKKINSHYWMYRGYLIERNGENGYSALLENRGEIKAKTQKQTKDLIDRYLNAMEKIHKWK